MNFRNHPQRRHDDFFALLRRFLLIIPMVMVLTAKLPAQDAMSTPAEDPAPSTETSPPAASTPTATSPPTATSTAGSLESMIALNDQAKLGNGDRVSYRVIEEGKEPVLLTVSDSGELDVPLMGRVTAAGKTCKELAYELKPLLEKEYFYHATVIIGVETLINKPLPIGKVYLTGQVARQGALELPPNESLTVSKAILMVGGLADFADRRRVKLVHKKPDGTTETTVVDLVEILDNGHTDRDPVLQPDDMIIVPQRLINF